MHPPRRPRKAIAPRSTARGAFAALMVANVALAFGPLFVRIADTGPVAAAFWRMALATPLLAIAMLAMPGYGPGHGPGYAQGPGRGDVRRLAPRMWMLLAVAGVAFAGDLGSWHLGIVHTTMSNATLFGNCATFLFPLWGFLVARAWPSRTQGWALALAAAGAALLMGRSYQLDPRHLVGDLLSGLAGLLYALYFIIMADVRRTLAPLPALTLSSLASLLPLLAFAGWLGERIVPVDWTPLIALALVSQVIGQGCMIYALGRAPPLLVGLTLLVQPIVATAIGWVWFGERLAAPDMIGVAMVAAALVLVRRTPETATTPSPDAAVAPQETR